MATYIRIEIIQQGMRRQLLAVATTAIGTPCMGTPPEDIVWRRWQRWYGGIAVGVKDDGSGRDLLIARCSLVSVEYKQQNSDQSIENI